jgi:hypothetical protein
MVMLSSSESETEMMGKTKNWFLTGYEYESPTVLFFNFYFTYQKSRSRAGQG